MTALQLCKGDVIAQGEFCKQKSGFPLSLLIESTV